MATWNDITGDPLVSRNLSKEGEENFDKIFGKRKTNGGWVPPPIETHKILKRETKWEGDPINLAKPTSTPTQPAEYAEDWQSSERDRAIAQNGNIGYTEEQVNTENQNDSTK